MSIFLQMSTAMMSAPSCASRTACARPWPRAAPVMKATLPSTRPVIGYLNSLWVQEFQLTKVGMDSQPRTAVVGDDDRFLSLIEYFARAEDTVLRQRDGVKLQCRLYGADGGELTTTLHTRGSSYLDDNSRGSRMRRRLAWLGFRRRFFVPHHPRRRPLDARLRAGRGRHGHVARCGARGVARRTAGAIRHPALRGAARLNA